MFAPVGRVLLQGLLPRQQLSRIFPLSYAAGPNSAVFSFFLNPYFLQEQFRSIHSDSSKHSENPLVCNSPFMYNKVYPYQRGYQFE